MGRIVLAEGWPIKEIKELPWKYGNVLNVKNSLYIKGDYLFSLSNGKNKTNKINRLLIWGEGMNNLIIDTDEDFYYALVDLSDELTKKIKNKN